MILAAAAVALLVSERGYNCNSQTSCPDLEQIRAATSAYEVKRLDEVLQIWEASQGPNDIVVGPHMFILNPIDHVRCVNESDDKEWATCSFRATWGKRYRESFIADFRISKGKWKIVDAKSTVEKLKDN